jgi:hypothetical protein
MWFLPFSVGKTFFAVLDPFVHIPDIDQDSPAISDERDFACP